MRKVHQLSLTKLTSKESEVVTTKLIYDRPEGKTYFPLLSFFRSLRWIISFPQFFFRVWFFKLTHNSTLFSNSNVKDELGQKWENRVCHLPLKPKKMLSVNCASVNELIDLLLWKYSHRLIRKYDEEDRKIEENRQIKIDSGFRYILQALLYYYSFMDTHL